MNYARTKTYKNKSDIFKIITWGGKRKQLGFVEVIRNDTQTMT